jgi:hypothetical protein
MKYWHISTFDFETVKKEILCNILNVKMIYILRNRKAEIEYRPYTEHIYSSICYWKHHTPIHHFSVYKHHPHSPLFVYIITIYTIHKCVWLPRSGRTTICEQEVKGKKKMLRSCNTCFHANASIWIEMPNKLMKSKKYNFVNTFYKDFQKYSCMEVLTCLHTFVCYMVSNN